MKSRTILYADEGKILTDGETFGKVIYLADDKQEEDFREITTEEFNSITEVTDGANRTRETVPQE